MDRPGGPPTDVGGRRAARAGVPAARPDGDGHPALPVTLAAVAGLALLVAHPPVGWWATTFVGPALLVAAVRARPAWAGRLGAVTGTVTFGPMLTWLVLPVATAGGGQAVGLLGWGLLVATQAAFLAVTAVLVRPWLASRWLPVVVAVVWTGIDAWRAVFPLGGFEWGAIAYAHVDGSFVLPVARILGGRGVTFLVVLVGVAAGEVVRQGWRAVRDRDPGTPVEGVIGVTDRPIAIGVVGLLLSVLITVEPPPRVGSLDVLAVQGNDIRYWEEDVADASFRVTTQMRDETVAAVGDGPPPDLTVWPEASVDTDPYTDRGARFLPLLEEAAATSDALLAGMNLDGPDPATGFHRTQLLLDRDGSELGRYDKRAVVPFGEYVPFRRQLDWFPPLQALPRDILPAPAAELVELDEVAIAVVICFETLFGDVTRENVLAGDRDAGLIVAATTDASFGDSAEPAQHLAQSQLRAVETGRWVVHAALSGSSAFVSPDGEVSDATELFTVDHIRRDVPVVEGRTPFLVVGDVLGTVTRVAVVAGLGWVLWRRRTARTTG